MEIANTTCLQFAVDPVNTKQVISPTIIAFGSLGSLYTVGNLVASTYLVASNTVCVLFSGLQLFNTGLLVVLNATNLFWDSFFWGLGRFGSSFPNVATLLLFGICKS